MATRSNIGIVNEDGSVTGIYVHWDGYTENVGKLLLKYYNTSGIVCELMDLGDLSSLNENLYCEDNYQYLFNNGKWQYRNHNGTWNELTARVCKCD